MPSSNPLQKGSLTDFIDRVAGSEHLRVEEDFGQGFVRLRSSEAERRQAAQDIRSSEDVIIELLRNSRDAGASKIYVATGKIGDIRTFIVIDDGSGVPDEMRDLIFEPRITSKLDSAHMDKWGLHGRGMALYSIAENSISHGVIYSSCGNGTSIMVGLSMNSISERKDQSTFPFFEIVEGTYLMRGPKNIQRTICEFALESRNEVDVYLGSYTEIAATLFENGLKQVPAKKRIFDKGMVLEEPSQMMSLANDPTSFCEISSRLGLEISNRSARRILDGQIKPVHTMLSRIENALVKNGNDAINKASSPQPVRHIPQNAGSLHIAREDIEEFGESVHGAFRSLCEKYYLEEVEPTITLKRGKLVVEYDITGQEE